MAGIDFRFAIQAARARDSTKADSRLHDRGLWSPGNCSSSNVRSVATQVLRSVSTANVLIDLPRRFESWHLVCGLFKWRQF
jgi:hypothetical protein